MLSIFQKFLVSRLSGGIALAAVFALTGLFFYVKQIGFNDCVKEQATQQIEIMEVRNEIANNRPDDNATIKRLRSGSF